jgi:hypothetical protein
MARKQSATWWVEAEPLLESLKDIGCEIENYNIAGIFTAGGILGKNGEIEFMISTGPDFEWAIASCIDAGLLEQLKDCVTAFVGVSPFIKYEFISDEDGGENRLAYEWSKEKEALKRGTIIEIKTSPDKRIIDLYGIDEPDDAAIASAQAAEAERKANAKVHGIYRGALAEDFNIETASEYDFFLKIYAMTYGSWYFNHEAMHRRIDAQTADEIISKADYATDFLLYHAGKRFGFETSEPEVDKRISISSECQQWYDFYNKPFERLSPEEKTALYEASERGENISRFAPEGNWRDKIE